MICASYIKQSVCFICRVVYDLHVAFIKSICASLHRLYMLHSSMHLHVYTVAHSVVKNAIKIKSTCCITIYMLNIQNLFMLHTPLTTYSICPSLTM